MSNELVYDPIREWRNDKDESRWSEYSLIQMNLTETKVVWDQNKLAEKAGSGFMRLIKLQMFSQIFSLNLSINKMLKVL